MRSVFLPLLMTAIPSGCVHPAAPTGSSPLPVYAYHLAMVVDFDTTLQPPPAHPSARAGVHRHGEEWSLAVTVTPTDRRGDGSLVERIDFDVVDVRGLPTSGSEGAAGASEAHPLEGRSMRMRRFDSGEILAVLDASHVLGADRQLEVVDLILPVLSPKVPALRRGDRVTWNTRWPLELGDDRQQLGMLRLTWSLVGVERVGGEPCWRVTYEGDWQTRIGQRAGPRPVEGVLEGVGTATGEAWISKRTGAVERHRFDWTRQVDVPAADGTATAISQTQRFSGSLERS